MLKSRFMKLLLALMLVALVAAPAMANNLAKHVTVSPNDKGDMLIYPVYFAADGLDTNLAVINTSDTLSCVVKVVIRSHKYSQELLDFLIYLSPNDEFKCTLSFDGSDYVMTSTDDSLCVATGTNPTVYKLATPCDGVVDTAAYGYAEMFEATSFLLPKGSDGTVPKSAIIAAYAGTAAVAVADTPNILTGFAELVFPGADYAAYQATMFEDYDNTNILNVAVETILGNGADNNLCEVETTLSKNNLAIPYYDSADSVTLPLFTFPTKLSRDCTGTVALGDFFQGANYNPAYTLQYYDLEEHTTVATCPHSPCIIQTTELPEEVNLILADSPYEEGWARASFAQNTACTDLAKNNISYTGAPVMSLALELTSNGLSILPVAFDYANVTYNRLNVTRQYQTNAGAAASPAPVCDADHLNLCTTEAACTGATGYWCNGACQATACATVPVCDGADAAACNAQADCTWQAFPTAKCILNCAQFGTQAACEAGLNGGCQWNAQFSACGPK